MARGRGRSRGAGRGTTDRGRGGRMVPYTLRGGSGPPTNADSTPVPARTGQPSTSQQAQVVQVNLEDLMGRIRAIVQEERAEHTGDTLILASKPTRHYYRYPRHPDSYRWLPRSLQYGHQSLSKVHSIHS